MFAIARLLKKMTAGSRHLSVEEAREMAELSLEEFRRETKRLLDMPFCQIDREIGIKGHIGVIHD